MSATSKDIALVDQVNASLPKNGARDTVQLSVAAGKVVGDLMRDKICLGDEGNLCADMGFLEATEMSDEPFSLFTYDGILGLGMRGVSLEQEFNYMAQLSAAEALLVNRFAVWLATPQDDGDDSEVTFGSANQERIGSAEVLWRPVTTTPATGLWQTTLSDVAVDSVQLKLCDKGGCQAAFDTGTGVIAGPTTLIHAVLSELNIHPDCTNYFDLPPLGFAFGGVMLNIEAVDYVKKNHEGCYHQFLALDIPPPKGPLVLLGVPFLQRYYTIYDSESLQIGIAFAKHKSSTKEGETPQQAAERLMVRFQGATEKSAVAGASHPQTPVSQPSPSQAPVNNDGSTQTWGSWVLQLLGDEDP